MKKKAKKGRSMSLVILISVSAFSNKLVRGWMRLKKSEWMHTHLCSCVHDRRCGCICRRGQCSLLRWDGPSWVGVQLRSARSLWHSRCEWVLRLSSLCLSFVPCWRKKRVKDWRREEKEEKGMGKVGKRKGEKEKFWLGALCTSRRIGELVRGIHGWGSGRGRAEVYVPAFCYFCVQATVWNSTLFSPHH